MPSQVAQTIAQQIGNRAFRMIGGRDLVASEKALTFKIGRNAKSVSHVRVTLEPSDTYKVEFLRVRKQGGVPTVKTVSEESDVYVDSLHQVIESGTGMYTKL